MCTNAFSLVELLVVITVLAILASLLLPAIGLVRDGAQRTSCAARLRSLSLGVVSYATDNSGHLPRNGVREEIEVWRGDWQNWTGFEMFPLLNTNIAPAGAQFLIENGAIDARSALCPGVVQRTPQRTAWWGGVEIGGIPSDYVYWGQADNRAGDNQGPSPWSFAPWARRTLGDAAAGNGTTSFDVSGVRWPAHVRLSADDVASSPVFADLCWRTPWYDDYSHGRSLATARSNTAHLDGHVSSRRVDFNAPFYWLTAWGGTQIVHYR